MEPQGVGEPFPGRVGSAAAAEQPGLEAAPARLGSEHVAEHPGPMGLEYLTHRLHPSSHPSHRIQAQKGIATRCERRKRRGSSPLHRCYFAQTIESVRRKTLGRRII